MDFMTRIFSISRRSWVLAMLCLFGGYPLVATSGAAILLPSAGIKVPTNQAISFSATSTCDESADAESAFVTYTWDFGNGTTGSGPSTSCAFSSPGSFSVLLTARWTVSRIYELRGGKIATRTTYYTYSATRVMTVLAPPAIGGFSSSTSSVLMGGAVTLNWTTSNATVINLSGVGNVSGSSTIVYPTATTSYSLTASNDVGSTSASLTVSIQPVTVSLSPGSASIKQGETVTFTASTSAANNAVSWSSTGGSITGGVFSGSHSSGAIPFKVRATSSADPSKYSEASVTVATVAVATPVPATADCYLGGTVAFTASVSGAANESVTWSVDGGGTISPGGVFTGATLGNWIVTATSNQDPSKQATASVRVVPLLISITPAHAVVRGGSSQQFSATVSGPGSPSQSVIWSIVSPGGGTITPDGAYSAPSSSEEIGGNFTIKATSVQDPSSSSQVTVRVPGWTVKWKKDILYVGTREVAEVSANGLQVTMTDHLGSPRSSWDGTNHVEQKFMPFGESLTNPANASKFAKGFTNHEQTDPSGLIYMQARFYAPWFGRFLSPDPKMPQKMENPQTWNLYHYVMNNPTMQLDPDGLDVKPDSYTGEMRPGDMHASQFRGTIQPRSSWGASPPVWNKGLESDRSKHRLTVHDAGESGSRKDMKGIQQLHMAEGFSPRVLARDAENLAHGNSSYNDIGYHFGISPDGKIFEGRPLDIKGSHVGGENTGNIGIVLLGTFREGSELPPAMAESLTNLIQYLQIQYPALTNDLKTHAEYDTAAGKKDSHEAEPAKPILEKEKKP